MKRALQNCLCILAALHLVGGHWGVLQMVAWAQMARTYTQESGILGGLQETFSGERPCQICNKIKKGKEEEKKQTPAPVEKSEQLAGKWLLTDEIAGLLPETAWKENVAAKLSATNEFAVPQWLSRPPLPPPRSVA